MNEDDSFFSIADNDSSLADINTFLHSPKSNKSKEKKQKTRRRPPMRKNILANLDLDALMDGVIESDHNTKNEETDPVDNKTENKKPKIEIPDITNDNHNITKTKSTLPGPLERLEQKFVNYFDFACKDLTTLFISELKLNLENLFCYDQKISKFLIEVRQGIADIFDKSIPGKNYVSNLYNQPFFDTNDIHLDDMFSILSLPTRSDTNSYKSSGKEDSIPFLTSEVNMFSSNYYDPKISLVNQIKSEKLLDPVAQISKNKKLKENAHYEMDKIRNHLFELKSKSEISEKLLKYIDKEIQKVRARQNQISSSYRYNTYYDDNYNDSDQGSDSLRADMEDILYCLRSKIKMNRKYGSDVGSYSNYTRKINDISESIKLSLYELQMKTNRLTALHNVQLNSYQQYSLNQYPQTERRGNEYSKSLMVKKARIIFDENSSKASNK